MNHESTANAQALSRAQARRRKTRNFLIYPKFQMRLILANSAILLLAFGAIAWQAWRSLKHIEGLGLATGLHPEHAFFKFISFQMSTLMSYLAVAFVVSTAFSIVMSLYLSHRIAGPIVRLNGYLKRIGEKGVVSEGPLKFRQGDFFDDLPESVNGAIDSVRKGGST